MSVITKSNILSWTIENINSVPEQCGVYVLRNFPSINGIIYIDSTENLKRRLLEHYISRDIPEVDFFDWYQTDSRESAMELKKVWIEKYSPKYNERVG